MGAGSEQLLGDTACPSSQMEDTALNLACLMID